MARPGNATRLMVGLHYLKHTFDELDKNVVVRWIENPYRQYFCGYKYIQPEFPIHPTSMTKWRNRVGSKRVEASGSALSFARAMFEFQRKHCLCMVDMPVLINSSEPEKKSGSLKFILAELSSQNGNSLRLDDHVLVKNLIFQGRLFGLLMLLVSYGVLFGGRDGKGSWENVKDYQVLSGTFQQPLLPVRAVQIRLGYELFLTGRDRRL